MNEGERQARNCLLLEKVRCTPADDLGANGVKRTRSRAVPVHPEFIPTEGDHDSRYRTHRNGRK